jgi:hypothetical protein
VVLAVLAVALRGMWAFVARDNAITGGIPRARVTPTPQGHDRGRSVGGRGRFCRHSTPPMEEARCAGHKGHQPRYPRLRGYRGSALSG